MALGSVSNAFNHPEKMRPETLKRVLDAAKRLGYAPNQSARILAGGTSRMIGLILPGLDHGISLQIANGASAEARKNGYGLLIATTQADQNAVRRYRDYFAGTQTVGMLIQCTSIGEGALRAYRGCTPRLHHRAHRRADDGGHLGNSLMWAFDSKPHPCRRMRRQSPCLDRPHPAYHRRANRLRNRKAGNPAAPFANQRR